MRSLPLILTGLAVLAGAPSVAAQHRGLDKRTIDQIRKVVRQEVHAALREALREMHGKALAPARKHARVEERAEAKLLRAGAHGSKDMAREIHEKIENIRKALRGSRKAAGGARVFRVTPPHAAPHGKKAGKKQETSRILETEHDGKHVRLRIEGLGGLPERVKDALEKVEDALEKVEDALEKAMVEVHTWKDGGHGKGLAFVLGPGLGKKVETKTFSFPFSFPGGKARLLVRKLEIDGKHCEHCEGDECEDCEHGEECEECEGDECECGEHERGEEEIEEVREHPRKKAGPRKPIRVHALRRRIHI